MARLVEGARALGYTVLPTDSAVVGVLIGEAADALAVGASLRAARVWAPAIRPPSVPVGTARMRLTVMATHEDRHIDWALDALAEARSVAGSLVRGGPLMLDERGIFVMGTDTGVGKTVVTAAIALAARAQGRTVAPLKPAQTGDDGTIAGDAGFVASLIGLDEPHENLCPYRLRAPLAPSVAAQLEGVRLDPGGRRRGRTRPSPSATTSCWWRPPAARSCPSPTASTWPPSPGCSACRWSSSSARASARSTTRCSPSRPCTAAVSPCSARSSAATRTSPGSTHVTNPQVLSRVSPVPLLGVIPFDPGIDVDAGRPGDLATTGPAGLDPLLGGTFSPARFRRANDARLTALTT